MTSNHDHSLELIAEANRNPETKYEQQPGTYVREAEGEFENAGLGREDVPRGAILMRAQELLEAEKAKRS
jgi:hypothetical protein